MTRFAQIPLAVAALILAPVASGAEDVCSLSDADLGTKLRQGAARISQVYAQTASQLSLNPGGAKGSVCNWECSSGSVVAPMAKAFGFLQYNCAKTTAPANTRRPTGSGTDSQMGLSITDADYRDAADAIFRSGSSGVGDLMQVPPSIEDASKSGKVQDVITAVEAISGAEWLKFSSTSVNNDNQGADRILIRVPDSEDPKRFEQWIQIAIKDGGGLGRNVDFIAHRLDTDPEEVVFRGYSRTAKGFVPEGFGSKSELSKCYSCHPSGLRTIVPATAGSKAVGGKKAMKPEGTMMVGATVTEQLARVKKITQSLTVFGPTGYTAALNGPVFGPSGRSGREDFVKKSGCAKGLKKERQEAIAKQMDCETCHDGSTDRGIVVAGTSRVTIYHKVVVNKEAPMPPDVTKSLSGAEREVLFACLKAEYGDLLREWLVSDLQPTTPSLDTSEPSADTTSEPNSDTLEPSSESSDTDSGTVEPSSDSSEGSTDTLEPSSESSDSETSEPSPEYPAPDSNESEATTTEQN